MRVDLSASIPLPAPFVLMVEPTNVCNFRCGICPESFEDYGVLAGYYQHMAAETWRRVVESMQGWERLKVIRFYHTGEPLLNLRLAHMVLEAHTFADRTEVTTNGSLLTATRAGELIRAGLDYLRVSVYGTCSESYRRQTGAAEFARVLSRVNDLRLLREDQATPHIHAELVTTEAGQEDLFRSQWYDIADTMSVKPLHNWGASLVQLGERPRKKVCPYPFYEMVVKANGDVSVCCVDWSNKLVVGNVNTESLREIWEGSRLQELRGVHLKGERSRLVACRECNVPDTCPDDLDGLIKA